MSTDHRATARGARKRLLLPSGRGRPNKAEPLPAHELIGQLDMVYRQHGKTRRRLPDTEEPAHQFIREVLDHCHTTHRTTKLSLLRKK